MRSIPVHITDPEVCLRLQQIQSEHKTTLAQYQEMRKRHKSMAATPESVRALREINRKIDELENLWKQLTTETTHVTPPAAPSKKIPEKVE